MFRKLSLAAAALAMGSTAIIPAAPAAAQRYDSRYDGGRYNDGRYDRSDYRDYRRDDRRYYNDNRRNNRDDRRYRANRQCRDGDGGTIVGAIAGGLLGREVAGRGDRTLGAVLGAGVGALAGRSIDRSDRPGYCR